MTIVAAQAALALAGCGEEETRLPDLTVTEVDATPGTLIAGRRLRVADRAANTGAVTAEQSRIAYYLVRGQRRIRLGVRVVGPLTRGDEAGGGAELYVPAAAAAGRYRITACANAGRFVAEQNTRNNCHTARDSVRVEQILPTPPAHAFWGARVGKKRGAMPPWQMHAQAAFEDLTAKRASLIHWGAPWQRCTPRCTHYRFDTHAARNVRSHGAISLYDWAPYSEPHRHSDRRFALRTIARGEWDPLIRRFASEVADWGHVLFLRFAWEMNGDWFPWGVGVNGNRAETYVRAWRRVHTIFSQVGARNVVWVWCPNVDPKHDWAPFADVYPGDAYVDWTCLDGYNWGTNPSGHVSGWQTFDKLYKRSYAELLALAPSKPMIVAEIGSTERGGSKAAWIRDMFGKLPDYPQIRGFAWFNDPQDDMDWPIDSSRSARDAFRAGVASSYFANRGLP